MPSDLPTTVIGLIAFIVAGAGWLVYRISNQQTQTFMTYIEKKNGNLERTTVDFLKSLEERDIKFSDTLISQGASHREAMDDLAARLEASMVKK